MPFASCAATLHERLEPMPGDDLVPDAVSCSTHAICIAAAPELVWPWLAQMGAGRAGWPHDRIDDAGPPVAERLGPDPGDPGVGDLLPGSPRDADGFVVARVDPPRELVLVWPSREDGCTASWAFVLRSARGRAETRLLVRARLSRAVLRPAAERSGKPRTFIERVQRALPHVPVPVVRAMAALGNRFLQARQLRGIKRRVEAAARG